MWVTASLPPLTFTGVVAGGPDEPGPPRSVTMYWPEGRLTVAVLVCPGAAEGPALGQQLRPGGAVAFSMFAHDGFDLVRTYWTAALRQIPANPNLVPAPELKKSN